MLDIPFHDAAVSKKFKLKSKHAQTRKISQIAVMRVYVRPANFTTKLRFGIVKLRSFTTTNSQCGLVEKNSHAETVKMQINFVERLGGGISKTDVNTIWPVVSLK